jgi:hypothetical protein
MDITGKWKGTIIYGKAYNALHDKKLFFEIDILQDNDKITGTSVDTGGVGTSLDAASIIGTMVENEINFIKQYSSLHSYSRDGQTTIDKSKPGPEIKYTGLYDENKKSFSGSWMMTVVHKILSVIPIKSSASGTWSMRKKEQV